MATNIEFFFDIVSPCSYLASTQIEGLEEAALKSTTDEAVARGAFGAPTFFVGEGMLFGNDRIEFGERAARGER